MQLDSMHWLEWCEMHFALCTLHPLALLQKQPTESHQVALQQWSLLLTLLHKPRASLTHHLGAGPPDFLGSRWDSDWAGVPLVVTGRWWATSPPTHLAHLLDSLPLLSSWARCTAGLLMGKPTYSTLKDLYMIISLNILIQALLNEVKVIWNIYSPPPISYLSMITGKKWIWHFFLCLAPLMWEILSLFLTQEQTHMAKKCPLLSSWTRRTARLLMVILVAQEKAHLWS